MARLAFFLALTFAACCAVAQVPDDYATLKPDVAKTNDCLTSHPRRDKAKFEQLRTSAWIRNESSDTVVVFIHGVWSDSVEAWLSPPPDCVYWPDLIADDANYFSKVDVYLAGYFSGVTAGKYYSIADAAGELYSSLKVSPDGKSLSPIYRKNILFIAHSLGGVVLRQMLVDHTDEFKSQHIGLALMASPSHGSAYANDFAKWLSKFFEHKLIDDLKTDSPVLESLDHDFKQYLASHRQAQNNGLPHPIQVAEFFESSFVVDGPAWYWLTSKMDNIVVKSSAGDYGDAPRILAPSNHLSIVKPTGFSHQSHKAVRDVFRRFFIGSPNVYTKSLGQLRLHGTAQPFAWQFSGPASQDVVVATEPCVGTACGPWPLKAHGAFNPSNLRDNDTGFVILNEKVEPTANKNLFDFDSIKTPDTDAPSFQNNPIYSGFVATARYAGPQGNQGFVIRTFTTRPVVYARHAAAFPDVVRDIPLLVGQEVTLDFPSSSTDATISVSGISGDFDISARVKPNDRIGPLVVRSVATQNDTTILKLVLWP